MDIRTLHGAGLGLRRSMLPELETTDLQAVDFFEVAPENWIGIGGKLGRQFRYISEQKPLFCHGLSLNLGGLAPLNFDFLRELKAFFREHRVTSYSEHLSACGDEGLLYDLMPLSFDEQTVSRVAYRIRVVQDYLEVPLIVENISAYAKLPGELSELEFVRAVLAEANCNLLLDVNNVYVNAHNFGLDAKSYVAALPSERIAYLHVAGHLDGEYGLKIDTHSTSICAPVWELLRHAYSCHGVRATLLERDFEVPPIGELYQELGQVRCLQAQYSSPRLSKVIGS